MKSSVSTLDGIGIHDVALNYSGISAHDTEALGEFARTVGISRKPRWITEVSYG